ncbi:hypothetical protein [Archangium violaceum]|nr:hypothetical protein [Archangium violaceum]
MLRSARCSEPVTEPDPEAKPRHTGDVTRHAIRHGKPEFDV